MNRIKQFWMKKFTPRQSFILGVISCLLLAGGFVLLGDRLIAAVILGVLSGAILTGGKKIPADWPQR